MPLEVETAIDHELRRAMRLMPPRTANQLHTYIRVVLGFDLPRRAMMPGHAAPFEYLLHSYFEDERPRDCLVWANRGGGKTQIGAIATLLDMLFKPGIQIRILGGSLEQSSKMHHYLSRILHGDVFNDLVAGNVAGRHAELVNGSRVEILSQSERSIRGHRVHKIRCDEVELFEPQMWEAAQLVTRSGRCGEVFVHGAVEALSTMHQPFGLMQRLVREATSGQCDRRLFRWTVLDTLTRCPPRRACEGCKLWHECQGRAKLPATRGFMSIDDAIQQKGRVGPETWAAEMLCERPTRSAVVYPQFNPALHVFGDDNAQHPAPGTQNSCVIGGIDFGYRAPTVVLLALHDGDDVVHIVDGLSVTEHTTGQIIALAERMLAARGLPRPTWLGADPAGHQRSEHTGVSTIAVWNRAGWQTRTRALPLEAGIQAVQRRLKRADGSIGLRIHRRCSKLIEALTMYHYDPDRPESMVPEKDGHDHAADALRNMIVNLDRGGWEVKRREY